MLSWRVVSSCLVADVVANTNNRSIEQMYLINLCTLFLFEAAKVVNCFEIKQSYPKFCFLWGVCLWVVRKSLFFNFSSEKSAIPARLIDCE